MSKPPYESWTYKVFWTAVLVLFLLVLYKYPQWQNLFKQYQQPQGDVVSERALPSKPEGELMRARVIRVVDGDTIVVVLNGREERVRLIGVDTPESSPNRKARRDVRRMGVSMDDLVRAGEIAKEYVKKLLPPGTEVKLELDVQPRDRYGRLLAYVYLPDGRMLNELLLREGLARLYTIPPNVKYVEKFREAQREARERGAGFWGELFR